MTASHADSQAHNSSESRSATSGPAPSTMSVPTLRPPMPPGSRSASRAPKLGLSIPVKGSPAPSRPPLPTLHIATPMGSQVAPQESLPRLMTGAGYSGSGSESSAAHSRTGSFGPVDGKPYSNPTSAGSGYSQMSFQSQYGLNVGRGIATPDPSSAGASLYSDRSDGGGGGGGAGMERESSIQGLEAFDKLAIERSREQDVEDLDEDGWRIVSQEKRVVELNNLGEGAGGAVTKCKLKGGKTEFALKIITSNPDPDVRKQILRELKFNRKCRDPHICRYYGAFEDPATSTLSIAMEFCEGGSLDSVYREIRRLGGRTGEKVLGKIAEGVLKGLTYLHSERIIHRDIKPSNILICRNGDIKLCDFGVSGSIFGTKGEADTFIGTSYYMAPERITGQPYTITSDVWSTGVTLLEVAQHRFPFPADGTESNPTVPMIDLLTYIVRQKTPELKDEPDNNIAWSSNFKYFIACCLEKDPNRRGKPWRMLEHPWMVDMASKRVNMTKFLAQVWGWDDKERAKKEEKGGKKEDKGDKKGEEA